MMLTVPLFLPMAKIFNVDLVHLGVVMTANLAIALYTPPVGGTLFVAAYPDGNPANKQVGMRTVNIPPGGGYTVELRIPDEGLYPFVTHSFAYTGLGALGVIKVGNPQMPVAMAAH